VFVVAGTCNGGVRDYPAGSFIHGPAGSSHVPQSVAGCTLSVFFPQGQSAQAGLCPGDAASSVS
jgi:hypothetical protein